jgi:hypothetical protein
MPNVQEFFLALEQSKESLGLIVTQKDPSQFVFPEARGGLVQVDISDETVPDERLSLIADCARRGRWCRLNFLSSEIPPSIYQGLRSIVGTGHLQYQKGGEVIDVSVAPGAKIICVIAEETLTHVSVPTFLNLFGIIHRE